MAGAEQPRAPTYNFNFNQIVGDNVRIKVDATSIRELAFGDQENGRNEQEPGIDHLLEHDGGCCENAADIGLNAPKLAVSEKEIVKNEERNYNNKLESDGGDTTANIAPNAMELPVPISAKNAKEMNNLPSYRPKVLNGSAQSGKIVCETKRLKIGDYAVFVEEETARLLIEDSNFWDAMPILEKLPASLHQRLMLAECHLHSARDSEAIQCRADAKKMMTSSAHHNVRSTIKLIDACIDRSMFVRAIILLQCATRLYEMYSSQNEAIAGIKRCVYSCAFKAIEPMLEKGGRTRAIAAKFGIDSLIDMRQSLHGIKGTDSKMKVYNESCCLNDIGQVCNAAGLFEKAVKYLEEGIAAVKKHYGDEAMEHRLYGHLYMNIGNAWSDLHEFSTAEDTFLSALDIFNKVQDWASDEEKRGFRKITERNLKNARLAMGKY